MRRILGFVALLAACTTAACAHKETRPTPAPDMAEPMVQQSAPPQQQHYYPPAQ